MNKQSNIRRHLTAGLLGVCIAISLSPVTQAHASGISGTVARIQSSVNALHTGVARTMGKIDQLRDTLKNLPEAQRQIIMNKLKEMNDPEKRHQRVENMMNTMDEISDPVQTYITQLLSKVQGKLADRMRGELQDGRPGPISVSFGMLYDIIHPIQEVVVASDSTTTSRSNSSSNNSQHDGHYKHGFMDDPQTLDDCIMHKSSEDEPSRADARCVIRLSGKPAFNAICDVADFAFDLANVNTPDDIASFLSKTAATAVPAVVKGLCVTVKSVGAFRNAYQIDDELRFKIESNLRSDKPLIMFQLPGEFGGKLEVVERVVRDTIDNASNASFNLGNAETEYAAGSNDFSNKSYASAYTHFANAYKAIMNAN